MSWSGLADNQCISFNNLQDAVDNGIFTPIAGIPASDFQITKSDAASEIVIPNPNYPSYAAKADNQLLVKSDIYVLGDVTLSPQYGMYFTGITCTGFPSFSYPVTHLVNNSYVNLLPAQTISIYLDGTRYTTPLNLAVYVNNVRISCQDITSNGYQVKYVTIPDIYAATSLYIAIDSGACNPAPPPPVFTNTSFNVVTVNRGSGQYMVAGNTLIDGGNSYGGYLYYSTNYGSTWTQTGTSQYWTGLASSDDGRYVLACNYYSGLLYQSSDYGASFTQITSIGRPGGLAGWQGPSLSGDGQYQLILASNYDGNYNNALYRSNDYGANWYVVQSSGYGGFISTAVNASGNVMLLGLSDNTNYIRRSTDYGFTWSTVYTNPGYYGQFLEDIGIIASGDYSVAANFGTAAFSPGYLVRSINSGASFIDITNGPQAQQFWGRCCINTLDGATAFATVARTNSSDYIKKLYSPGPSILGTVTNLTSSPQKRWQTIRNSDNGNYILAGEYNGLWLSSDGGASFSQL